MPREYRHIKLSHPVHLAIEHRKKQAASARSEFVSSFPLSFFKLRICKNAQYPANIRVLYICFRTNQPVTAAYVS